MLVNNNTGIGVVMLWLIGSQHEDITWTLK